MVYCCVPYCKSSSLKNSDSVSFHEFPSDIDKRNQWLKAIARKNFCVNDKSASSVVCSKHFRNDDFGQGLKKRRLLPYAFPSVFKNYPAYLTSRFSKPGRNLVREKCKSENYLRSKEPHRKRKQDTVEDSFESSEKSFEPNGNIAEHIEGNISSKLKENLKNLQAKFSHHENSKHVADLEKINLFEEEVGNSLLSKNNRKASSISSDKMKSSNLNESKLLSENLKAENVLVESDIYDEAVTVQEEMTDDESISDIGDDVNGNLLETVFDSDGSIDNAEEFLKRKLEKISEHYENAHKKMKFYRQKCKLYVKQSTALKEVINSLKQINAVPNDT